MSTELTEQQEQYRDYLRGVIDRRLAAVKSRGDDVMHKKELRGNVYNPVSLANRGFLEKHAVGSGVDICCGDFLIGDAMGVDITENRVGTDFNISGDALTIFDDGALDYVVTNYLEALPNTLGALNEWKRCLKPGGTLAICCTNAEKYAQHPSGALQNHRRLNTFTKLTLSHCLHRAGFRDINIEEKDVWLWAEARRKK